MIIIITKNGSKFWTEEYKEVDGFLQFITTTKAGKKQTHEINKQSVEEITQLEIESDK